MKRNATLAMTLTGLVLGAAAMVAYRRRRPGRKTRFWIYGRPERGESVSPTAPLVIVEESLSERAAADIEAIVTRGAP